MSNWFTLATWPLTAHCEITWKHFEDIRRGIFILQSCMVTKVQYEDTWQDYHQYTYYGTQNGYRKGSVIGHDGIYWVANSNNLGYGIESIHAPYKNNWRGWLPYADSTKYYHYCQNSLYHLGFQCGHSDDYQHAREYVCHASEMLPTQVWYMTNCNFPAWSSSTAYKVGDKVSVSDTAIERDGMICGYICTATHTNDKPTSIFPSTSLLTGGSHWRAYGDPVEVSATGFISKNSGSRFTDNRGNGLSGTVNSWPYGIGGGWPDESESNEYHSDFGYKEYQAAVERVCEGAWMFSADGDYYWTDQTSNEKPQIALGNDWRWNCNRSTFELILKKMGSFSWYWDDSYPPHNQHTYLSGGLGLVCADLACDWCNVVGGNSNVEATTNHPVWRRTWRYAMDGKSHLRAGTLFSDSHRGAYPPSVDSDPAGYATSQIVLDHTENAWHGNPHADCLNDIKLALELCSKLNWGVSVSWYEILGSSTLPVPPMGNRIWYDSAGDVYTALDASARQNMADIESSYGWSAASSPVGPVQTNGAIANYYMEEWTYTYNWLQWAMGCLINRLKLIISVNTPPRNAIVSGGVSLKSYGRAGVDWPDHQSSGSVENRVWTSGIGAIPALTSYPESYFQSYIVPVPPATGGEVVIIFEPPTTKITSKYSIPHSSCEGHLPTSHDHATEAYVYGLWEVETDKFYITIDKTIGII